MNTRERHYVITLQRMCEDGVMRYATNYGDLSGHDDEGEAFELVWDRACMQTTEKCEATGVKGRWTPENSAVLFYRLAEYR